MVEQTARKLAEELINSEYGQAFITAKKAYDEDLEAQKMVQDYVNKQNAFQNRLGNEDVPDEDKDAFYEEINALNTAIRERGTSGALYKAESDFNEYYSQSAGIGKCCNTAWHRGNEKNGRR